MSWEQVTFAPIFPIWLIVVLFFLGGVAVIVQYRLIRGRLGSSRALGVSILRWIALSFLIALALNPSLVTRKEHTVSPAIAILLDTSASMGQPGSAGKADRLEEAKSFLLKGANPLLQTLSQKYEVRLYGVSESLNAIEAADVTNLKAGERKGDLTQALKELGRDNSVALLLSDGNWKWDGKPPTDIPLLTVPVGNSREYRDILIEEVRAPALAFRGREVTIDVTVKGYGYNGLLLLPVLLKDGNRLLTAKNVRLPSGTGSVSTSLSFTPEEVGLKSLSVSVPVQAGENLTSNNLANLSLKVARDKIRVLMVSGSPSMNYRFLRTALKADPSVDLLSFVILRTPSDIINVPTNEQSLIPFPVETLFIKEIKNFDLLIFDNFRYLLYLSPHHLESIKDFVRGGGAFALVGGPSLQSEGGFTMTPISEILPIRFSEKDLYRRDSPTGVKLSRAGAIHPITRLASEIKGDEADPSRLWREMPPLDGINLVEAKSSATVLLESSTGVPWPILAVSNYGAGRSLALATDYSWKWYMGPVARGEGNLIYLKFVDRMVRWLTKDPGLEPVQITLPEDSGRTGAEMEIRVKVQEEGMAPGPRSMISLSVFSPDGLKIDSTLKPTGRSDELLGAFVPPRSGVYKVKVETPSGVLEDSVVVKDSLESLDAAPDPDRLKAVSEATKGIFLSNGDDLLKKIEGYARRGESRFVEEKRSPMWATSYVMVLILVCLITEWYFRRRWGLV
jgi:uncharacterized membrane protein/multisubunit Na+/H+ antiporter MnhF subunit